MAMIGIEEFIVAVLVFAAIYYWRLNKHTPITNCPLLGMLPGLFYNVSNFVDYINSTLQQNGGTFIFKGPWLTSMNMVFTNDFRNVQHITSTKFENYGKGDNFREIFEILGDGIFRSDSHEWKYNRTILHSIFKQTSFQTFLHKTFETKVDNSLLVFLDHVSIKEEPVDLQDVFQRLTFDNICSVVLGFDPSCLSIELPQVPCERAFTQIEDTIFYRHVKPRFFWKLQKWLQIGEEKKFIKNHKIIDQMLFAKIATKREMAQNQDEKTFDLITLLMNEIEKEAKLDDKFLRDTAMNLLAAGRDTISAGLTWFFWLVATHPFVESKILKEIRENLPLKDKRKNNWKDLGVAGLSKLVYLHGALCEALRLYPPVPLEHKCPLKSDVLPSGHRVKPNTMIVYSLYSVGRVKEIWGEDCLEFKPERWISNKGGIVHVPSYKFIAFNAGPRSCLGKDISFTEMKMVAVAILWNYHIHVVEGHPVTPSISVILHMKHGLKVVLKKRSF